MPSEAENSGQKPVLVAAIAGAFGVKGEVRLKSFTQDPAACLQYAPFTDDAGKEILVITTARAVKDGFVISTPQITSREQAEALKSTKLYALRSRFAEPDEDDFYQADLLGLKAFGEDGQPIGVVKAVLNFGASDLLEIADTPGAPGVWTLPFTRHHVPKVDVAGGKVVLRDVESFIDPGATDVAAKDGTTEDEEAAQKP